MRQIFILCIVDLGFFSNEQGSKRLFYEDFFMEKHIL
jgi:hypothetical protein